MYLVLPRFFEDLLSTINFSLNKKTNLKERLIKDKLFIIKEIALRLNFDVFEF